MAATIVLLLQLLATVTTVRAESHCQAWKSKVDTLTSEITLIEERLDAIQKATNDNDRVYFTATIAKDTVVKSGKQVIFNNVILNIGNGYDNTTGVFTAPFSGVYEFTLSTYSTTQTCWLGIFQAGRPQTSVAAHGHKQASTAIMLRVAAGEAVDVRGQLPVSAIHSAADQGRSYPVFTGKLLMAE